MIVLLDLDILAPGSQLTATYQFRWPLQSNKALLTLKQRQLSITATVLCTLHPGSASGHVSWQLPLENFSKCVRLGQSDE